MRADARQNRERILDVARAALEAGDAPPMTAIAQSAGVGQGTLYRHFPTWHDLVLEVHRTDMTALADLAPALLKVYSPTEALEIWLKRLADYGRIKKGLSAALHDRLTGEGFSSRSIAIDQILAAGAADGSLRPDVTGEDVVLLVGFLWRLEPTPDRTEQADRLMRVVLDGLRTS